ncbi:MAG: SDR family NAD(P)-dependent oxidoreductase [Candidatus Palauibacterales bacterium]|nr:SDR family NAD(P)-dependent oxidoreductase [Candidatus Palauibacterales bacterium]
MELGLEGKAAIVTGGRSGIGAAIARRLAEEGCDVAIVDRLVDRQAHEVVAQVEAAGRAGLAIEADVRDFAAAGDAVGSALSAFGRLDILVCNAGINRDGVIWKMSEENWDEVIDVNLKGCFNYCRSVARVFRERKRGTIVLVSSVNGLRGKFGQTNYSASKGGEIALTKALARELGRYDVNVNAVAPGMVRTEMTEGLPREVMEGAIEESALGRIAEPDDCADLVAFLCSDRARHITGEIIKVDGGQYI